MEAPTMIMPFTLPILCRRMQLFKQKLFHGSAGSNQIAISPSPGHPPRGTKPPISSKAYRPDFPDFQPRLLQQSNRFPPCEEVEHESPHSLMGWHQAIPSIFPTKQGPPEIADKPFSP